MAKIGKILELTDASFGREVLEANVPVLVDFWAPWSGPCRDMGPALEALAAEYDGRAKVAKLNVDAYPGFAGALRIQSTPTVAVFDGQNVVELRVGARPQQQYHDMLEHALAVHGG